MKRQLNPGRLPIPTLPQAQQPTPVAVPQWQKPASGSSGYETGPGEIWVIGANIE